MSRAPNELESLLHQAALAAPNNELTAKQAESIVPDPTLRQNALNFLLAVRLFKGLVNKKSSQVVFKAIGKHELDLTKGLSGEENLVFNHIKAAGNEGIWTKHLKSKTSLHQSLIDRSLKTLTQKHLIKRVQSVQHTTRKIYMLQELEPSIALTGGPWYTDNELDAEFIRGIGEACWRIIWDISFPKRKNHTTSSERILYPPSNPPPYPTAEQIKNTLKKARLTDTELTVQHVEMLLNVLVLDGKIERLPAFSISLWNHQIDNREDEDEDERPKRKKQTANSDEDSDDSNDEEDDRRSKKKKRKKMEEDSDEEQNQKKKKKKQKRKDRSSSEEDKSGSESVKKKKKFKKTTSPSTSPPPTTTHGLVDLGGGTVYRALLDPPSAVVTVSTSTAPSLLGSVFSGGLFGSSEDSTTTDGAGGGGGGLLDAPCGTCPVFEFCKSGGPVDPRECVYYDRWLNPGRRGDDSSAEVKMES